MIPLRFTVSDNYTGISLAPRILAEAVTLGLTDVGKLLQTDVRARMRDFTGEEKRNVRIKVTGKGMSKSVIVFSTLIQAFIDELGLPPGTFPPFDTGTLVYRWANRRGLRNNRPREEHHNYGVKRRRRRVSHLASRRPRHLQARRVRQVREAARGNSAQQGRTGPEPTPKRAGPKGKSNRVRARQSSLRRASFLVARAIFERGIKAGKPFTRSLKANESKIVAAMQNAFIRAVARINRGGLNA